MAGSASNPNRFRPWTVVLRPFQEFARLEASSGILLFACSVGALAWANSSGAAAYFDLFATRLGFTIGPWTLSKPALLWINDGLMAVFFFLVGLEIKREFLGGELATARQAALPIAGALGGMLAPAALYALFTAGTDSARGWGVPMATDIAFALGVLALLGKRVPLGLKVFVAALAIVDDLGAVLVIAVFYTENIEWLSLLVAVVLWLCVLAASRAGLHSPWGYFIPGCLVWLAGLLSGVHATIAGVMMAFTIPIRARVPLDEFIRENRQLLDEAQQEDPSMAPKAVARLCQEARAPLRTIEHGLHPWVVFVILPLFALANAGVVLSGNLGETLARPVSLGILAGLVAGKPVGILAASWFAVKAGVAALPESVDFRQIAGAGCLAGIGFTMSLFIAALAFPEEDTLAAVKVSVLVASLLAGAAGYAWLALGKK